MDLTWPQQPPAEKVLKFNMSFHDSVKKIFFQNIKISPQINEFKNLDHSEVQVLEASAASLTSAASATLLASTASKAQFPQKTS